MARVLAQLIIAGAFVVLSAGGAIAQSGRGTISGAVSDASGGMVPFADVTARDLDTGLETSAQRTNRACTRC